MYQKSFVILIGDTKDEWWCRQFVIRSGRMTMIFFRRLIYYFTTYEAILEIEFYESIELDLTHLSPHKSNLTSWAKNQSETDTLQRVSAGRADCI